MNSSCLFAGIMFLIFTVVCFYSAIYGLSRDNRDLALPSSLAFSTGLFLTIVTIIFFNFAFNPHKLDPTFDDYAKGKAHVDTICETKTVNSVVDTTRFEYKLNWNEEK